MHARPTEQPATTPWWRVGLVWLVLAGPIAVVLAGLVTFAIAFKGAEPVLQSEEGGRFADRPAVQGRNHAATDQPGR